MFIKCIFLRQIFTSLSDRQRAQFLGMDTAVVQAESPEESRPQKLGVCFLDCLNLSTVRGVALQCPWAACSSVQRFCFCFKSSSEDIFLMIFFFKERKEEREKNTHTH